MGRVCSLDEPQDVELVIENPGRDARSLRLRDDVPDEFSAEPAAFDVRCPGGARRFSPTDSCPRSGEHMFSSRLMPWWPAGWASGGASIAGRCAPRCGFTLTFIRSRGSRCLRGETA